MKSRKLIYGFLIFLIVGCSEKPEEAIVPVDPPVTGDVSATFTNPILPRAADPWVIERGGTYYFTYTSGSKVVLQSTKKMSELDKAPVITIWTPPAGMPYSQNIWAPELHYIDGKWYVYFAADNGSNANHRMFVLESTSESPTARTWQYKGKISDSTNKWAIDGSILEHEGKMYFIWSGWEGDGGGSQEIYIASMSNPWTINSERVQISRPEFTWEINGGRINEGPQMLRSPNGRMFIVYSASSFLSDDYALGLLSLKEGGNPMNAADWQKTPTPVFTRKSESGVFGPGHNAFFKSPDGTEDWIIYHARSLPGGGSTNYRNIRMQKFTWNEDDTPNFGEAVRIGAKLNVPSGE